MTAERIVLISGKRKCGKDYVSENLKKKLGERCQIVRISEPIKSEWASKMQLDLKELLGDGPYKEKYRKDMIEWSDKVRQKDYGYFCRTAMEKAVCKIIVVSDVRRTNDIRYFKETYDSKVFTVRLKCPDSIRTERGWRFTPGIDDVESECGLDEYVQWDLTLENGAASNSEQLIDTIINAIDI